MDETTVEESRFYYVLVDIYYELPQKKIEDDSDWDALFDQSKMDIRKQIISSTKEITDFSKYFVEFIHEYIFYEYDFPDWKLEKTNHYSTVFVDHALATQQIYKFYNFEAANLFYELDSF